MGLTMCAMGLNLRLKAASEPDYQSVYSPHFTLFYEAPRPPAGILNDLEGIHSKLLLDLVSFAPWARNEKIRVVLYNNQESYHRHTPVAAWAGGHVDLVKRTIYCYETPNLRRTLAHEMAHLFFDDYFVGRKSHPPVWLTEGVATLMEWQYGLEDTRPLEESGLLQLAIPLEEFFSMEYGGRTEGEKVSRWYLQAYSIVKFLMRRFSHDQFVEFCRLVGAGQPIEEALRLGYGLQMDRLIDLERMWRRDLRALSLGN